MPKPEFLNLQPLTDLVELDGPDGWWQATGTACSFRLMPGPGGLPKGWIRFTVPVDAPRNAVVAPAFEVDCGGGYWRLRTLLPRRSADGRWTVVLHIPPNAIALSMSAPVALGPFRLRPVEARAMTRSLVGTRLAISLGQRWLREPTRMVKAAHDFRNAWRADGRAGLRAAVSLTLLEDGPVSVPSPAISASTRYQQWIAEHERRTPSAHAAVEPRRCSLLIPVGAGGAERLPDTLAALQTQAATEWECLIGLGSDADAEGVAAAVQHAASRQIVTVTVASTERGALLAALAATATGDLLLVLDPGDRLAPEALAALAAPPGADIIHGDEDRIDATAGRSEPFLKPEWSPELLHAFNYFGRPTALRREMVEQIGGFTAGLGAGTEWDLHLRLTAAAASVVRVPGILCHRLHGTGPDRPQPDQPAAAQNRAVLSAHWQRHGITATVTTQPDGTQRSVWPIIDAPLVSIIIPNLNQPELLGACLRGLENGTDYPRIQIIIVDSGSTDPATLALYARLQAERRVEVVPFIEHFNYSAACNLGARAARGELLLFLNNDIEVTTPDWLSELVRFVLRPGVGVVGTMLVYPNGTLQHAGVTIGMHLCGLLFRGAPETAWGPFGSPMVPRTLSAIMGACQMVRREVFARVGGFDETYVMANSDVALCLAARAAGWRTAYTPFARLVHHEGASRGHRNPAEDLTRSSIDIRRFGYDHDPFFHPALDAESNIPRLRIGAEPGNAASLRQDLLHQGAGLVSPVPLDLGNDAEVAAAVGVPIADLLWPPPLPEAINDQWSAARWCLDLLRRRPDLHERFPDALSAGARGNFAQWLASDGAHDFRMPAAAIKHIRSALAAGIAARARQTVLIEAKLSGELALAFLPLGRAVLLRFLLRRDGPPLRLEEMWWLALECAENPARELVLSYRFNPGWQALFPDGLTVFGREHFAKWFRAVYRCRAPWTLPANWPETLTPAQQIRLGWNARTHWQHQHPDPFVSQAAARVLLGWLAQPAAGLAADARGWLAAQPTEPLTEALAVPGVNVIGHFCYPSGLRTSVLSVVQGLRSVSVGTSLRDVPTDSQHDLPNHDAYGGFEEFDTTLLHIQPEPFFGQAFERSGLHARRRRTHRIGYWYWEFESVPASWADAVAEADELWAATRFVGDALRSRFDIPVFDLMPGVELPQFSKRSPDQFGIPPGQFTFLFAFHMMSIMERKNPLGLIRAFRLAFSAAEPVTLVLKTSFGEKHPELIGQLHAAANEAGGRVMIIDRVFTTDETISLMDACDAYISLHRSEGFGLTMAEAMLLAKPVIATGYSGNLDFMNDKNSLLTDYRMVEIDNDIPPYTRGSLWAEPSEVHAAQLMRRIWENQAFAMALGTRAKADITANLSMVAAGRRMANRLAVIRSRR